MTGTATSTGRETPGDVEVIANGEKAIYVSNGTDATGVEIVKCLFSPEGLQYELKLPPRKFAGRCLAGTPREAAASARH
jgi:hypothetical protein